MTTGIFVTARVGSTRLPQKHLIDAHQKTFIEWLVGRYLQGFRNEISRGEVKVAIVTSTERGNEKFREVFQEKTFLYSLATTTTFHLDTCNAR
jgi:spore coat polysaccharide biosynthesis protein SpsF (cytidylyltransferase family)